MKTRERLLIYPLVGFIAIATLFGSSAQALTLQDLDFEAMRQALKTAPDLQPSIRDLEEQVIKAMVFARDIDQANWKTMESLGFAKEVQRANVFSIPISSGARFVTKYLLDRGADPNKPLSDGYTPVMRATKGGLSDIVDLLIKYGAKPLDPATSSQLRFLRAAGRGDLIAIKRELRKGAQVNRLSPAGETALIEAIKGFPLRSRSTVSETVRLLLRLGADPNMKGSGSCVGGRGSPLHAIVCFDVSRFETIGGAEIMEVLLKDGAYVSSVMSFSRWTPLHLAAMDQNAKAVKILLEAGAKVMSRGKGGKTPLDYAEAGPVIKLLKAYGAKELPR